MKLKKYFKGLILVNSVLLLAYAQSCTGHYDKLNTNPNELTDKDLESDYLNAGRAFLPQIQLHIFPIGGGSNDYQRMQNLIGDSYSGYMGGTGIWFGNNNGLTYFLQDDWNKVPFNHTFTEALPAWLEIKSKWEEENSPETFALAQIMKVMAVHRIADMYGPLPYFEYGNGILTMPYDSLQDIYESFFADLDDAIEVLTEFDATFPGSQAFANFDLVYLGNIPKWIRFANSLKLRLAMRTVYADPVNAEKRAKEAVSNPFGVMESNDDNAILHSALGTQFVHPLKMIWDNYGDTRMGATIESFMVGYNDPRLPHYFRPAKYTGAGARTYMGVRNGIRMDADSRAAYLNYSIPNFDDSNTTLQWMCAAEIYFLRAEGALRNWAGMGGTAKELYEQGITTSFEQYGVQAQAPSYIANSTLKPTGYTDTFNGSNNIASSSSEVSTITIAWNESAGFEGKLERIITQKYLAMFPDGQEAWSEFRRTKYPKVFKNVLNYSSNEINTDIQIRRIKYPLDEHNKNGEELKKVINNPDMLNGPDTGGTKLWWDKK